MIRFNTPSSSEKKLIFMHQYQEIGEKNQNKLQTMFKIKFFYEILNKLRKES